MDARQTTHLRVKARRARDPVDATLGMHMVAAFYSNSPGEDWIA